MNPVKCPKCNCLGKEEDFGVVARQGNGIVDVGFRCYNCGYEFGFEYFMEDKLNVKSG